MFSLFAHLFLGFSPFFVDQNLWVILMPQYSVNSLRFISSDLNSDSASPNMPFKFLLIPFEETERCNRAIY
jgi:hypothetical protein